MDVSEWRKVIDNNLTGAMLSFRAASRQTVAQGTPGSLVAISSIISRFGGPGRSHYAAAKTAVHALVMSTAIELARYRIRCNSLAPGWTKTDLVETGFDPDGHSRFEQAIMARTPTRRWGTTDDYAAVAVLLLDPEQSYHTGDMLTVDGGYTIV
jgi:NAD(P)-dependent dehydrogenase (short-subunit alcohol dehydrogenase family)